MQWVCQASFGGLVEAATRVGDLSKTYLSPSPLRPRPMAEYWYDEALKVGLQMEGPSYAKLCGDSFTFIHLSSWRLSFNI